MTNPGMAGVLVLVKLSLGPSGHSTLLMALFASTGSLRRTEQLFLPWDGRERHSVRRLRHTRRFSDELISLGISSSRLLGAMYNSQATIASDAAGYVDLINEFSLPGSVASGVAGAIVQANYTSIATGATINAAYVPAGFPGAGNWPVWLMNDLYKWYLSLLDLLSRELYSGVNAVLGTGSIEQGFYEGGLTTPIASAVPGANFLANDCMSHPSWADTYHIVFRCQSAWQPDDPW